MGAASATGIIGAEVFTGKVVRGRVLPMKKKAWAANFKKYAVLAGVNEPKKSCHGLRKARAEVAAYADCTESQMMTMFGWTDPKMPANDRVRPRLPLQRGTRVYVAEFPPRCTDEGTLSALDTKPGSIAGPFSRSRTVAAISRQKRQAAAPVFSLSR